MTKSKTLQSAKDANVRLYKSPVNISPNKYESKAATQVRFPFLSTVSGDGTSPEGEVEEEGNGMGRGFEYRLRFSRLGSRDRKREKTLTIGLHKTSAT